MRKHTKEETMALLQEAARKWVDDWGPNKGDGRREFQGVLARIKAIKEPDKILDLVFEEFFDMDAEEMAKFVMEALTETEVEVLHDK